MNEEQRLPYWQLIIKKVKITVIKKTESISSPIHNNAYINLYNMNYYVILKQNVLLLHKLNPR